MKASRADSACSIDRRRGGEAVCACAKRLPSAGRLVRRCLRTATPRWLALRTLALPLTWIALLAISASPAVAQQRLFEQTPFDQITLKDQTVIKVSPPDFPGGRLPESPRPSDRIIVRLIDRPTENYELHWRDIAEYKQFDRLILDEAERLTTAGKLAEAFAFFDFLERNRPSLPGLAEALQRYLFEDAKDCQRRKKYAEALTVLDELASRNPAYPGLDRAWGAATDRIIEPEVARENFAAARLRWRQLQQRFPQDAVTLKWQKDFESRAEALVQQAKQEQAAQNIFQARRLVFAALDRWPAHEAARRLALELFAQAPSLNVAVTQPLTTGQGDPLTDWAARRTARLLSRSLLELTGYGAEGGQYRTEQGEFSVGELGLELNVRLRPDLKRADGQPFTGYDLSQFLARQVVEQPDSVLAQLLDRTTVRAVYQVDVSLRRPHVRPEALLSQPITMRDPSGDAWTIAAIAPYRIAEQSPELVRFHANAAQRPPGVTGPSEITEQTFPQVAAAVGALERGEVMIVDRLNPWDVAGARELPGVVVEAYAVPTVHVLVPNLRNPLLQKRIFRRALVYGINREAILQVQLLRGAQLAETRVTSGPFPVGYAYSDQVETRPYEPRMAMMLAEIAIKEHLAAAEEDPSRAAHVERPRPLPGADNQRPAASDAVAPSAGGDDGDDGNGGGSIDDADGSQPEAGEGEPGDGQTTPPLRTVEAPPLRLAHPATEVVRLACRAIQRQLKLVGIPIELVELTGESAAQAIDQYDLVYVELQLEEPIADARRLFGAGGLAAGSSTHIVEALARLEAAVDWKSAREALHRIHRVASDDVAMIPLWQLSEHFAYRSGLQSLPQRPVVLYQDVDNWQVEPYLPPAKP